MKIGENCIFLFFCFSFCVFLILCSSSSSSSLFRKQSIFWRIIEGISNFLSLSTNKLGHKAIKKVASCITSSNQQSQCIFFLFAIIQYHFEWLFSIVRNIQTWKSKIRLQKLSRNGMHPFCVLLLHALYWHFFPFLTCLVCIFLNSLWASLLMLTCLSFWMYHHAIPLQHITILHHVSRFTQQSNTHTFYHSVVSCRVAVLLHLPLWEKLPFTPFHFQYYKLPTYH